MRTTKPTLEAKIGLTGAGVNAVDPEDLWLDQDIPPEELIRLDPLDITAQMVEQAENPEEADDLIRGLRPRRFNLRLEELQRKLMRFQLRKLNAERAAAAQQQSLSVRDSL